MIVSNKADGDGRHWQTHYSIQIPFVVEMESGVTELHNPNFEIYLGNCAFRSVISMYKHPNNKINLILPETVVLDTFTTTKSLPITSVADYIDQRMLLKTPITPSILGVDNLLPGRPYIYEFLDNPDDSDGAKEEIIKYLGGDTVQNRIMKFILCALLLIILILAIISITKICKRIKNNKLTCGN